MSTTNAGSASKPDVYNPWRVSLENCISGDNYLRASEYRDLIEELDDLYRWRAAIDDALVCAHLGVATEPYDDLNKLLQWHHDVWLDPAVSSDAQALIDLGRAEADAEIARLRAECDAITDLNHAQWSALENVRLLAARHRKEEWAAHMLRFCSEAGNKSVAIHRAAVDAAIAKGEGA